MAYHAAMKNTITISQFAEALGVSRSTVERMIKQNKIKAVKMNPLAGRTSPLLIPAAELERVKRLQSGTAKR